MMMWCDALYLPTIVPTLSLARERLPYSTTLNIPRNFYAVSFRLTTLRIAIILFSSGFEIDTDLHRYLPPPLPIVVVHRLL